MVNRTLAALTTALHEAFGDGYHYYVETVHQDLQTPAFTVDMLNPTIRSESAVTYFRTMPVVIHFFSGDKVTNKHTSYSIADEVVEALEYITIENRLYRGQNMEFSLVDDDVLQIFVTYRFWTETKDTPTYMEDLESINQRT